MAIRVGGIFLIGLIPMLALGQSVFISQAPKLELPAPIDGNSPSFWTPSGFHMFSSTGQPQRINRSVGMNGPWERDESDVSGVQHMPIWVESAWRDEDGTLFGWYHHEPGGVCSNGLTSPKIGAVISFDDGLTLTDLGIVLESGVASDCGYQNGFFAGGHGDFSVVLDRQGEYFYFFFTNYSGEANEQGIAMARLAFADRFHPAGSVRKFFRGGWVEPGIGGRVTPLFPAYTSWRDRETDSYWGPSVHWNTAIEKYVMLLNRACCAPGWPQEGIYLAFGDDLTDPYAWSNPERILEGEEIEKRPGFYPQVIGLGAGETDSLAGAVVRLFVHGVSRWELRFGVQGVDPPPVCLEGKDWACAGPGR